MRRCLVSSAWMLDDFCLNCPSSIPKSGTISGSIVLYQFFVERGMLFCCTDSIFYSFQGLFFLKDEYLFVRSTCVSPSGSLVFWCWVTFAVSAWFFLSSSCFNKLSFSPFQSQWLTQGPTATGWQTGMEPFSWCQKLDFLLHLLLGISTFIYWFCKSI